ncbi:MAG TPA: FKBP-type peptidyl-prolyl cis-trans isomerase [Opitutales bacterium]|nr:FKBP-type peptidyl-prolyl cis-trans isomerase [Opitutales bacterium]
MADNSNDNDSAYEQALRNAEAAYKKKMESLREQRLAIARENARLGEAYVNSLSGADKPEKRKSGLYFTVLVAGDAAKMATKADSVRVNYEGRLIDGKTFDKSRRPVEFPVSAVVAGFSEGVQLVGEGGKVRLYIPGDLGYGVNPPPGSSIQPGSMLVFDVEIVEVIKG